MKKTIITIILIVLALGLLLWLARPEASTQADNEVRSGIPDTPLTLSESYFDLGRVRMSDGLVSRIIALSNNSGADVMLSKVTTSCMCTVAYLGEGESRQGPYGMPGHGRSVPPANKLVKSGESIILQIVFDPNAHGPAGVGKIERFVNLEDENGNVSQIRFEGFVTP